MTTAPRSWPASVPPPPLAQESNPFVLHGCTLKLGSKLQETSRFSDDVWNLGPAMVKKHDRRFILDFRLIPAAHRHGGKELCYAMLSGPAPCGETQPAAATVRTVFTELVRFLRWAAARSGRLETLSGADLEDYQRFLIQSLPRASARQSARAGARKFWLWRSCLSSDALRFDPAHIDGWGENAAHRRENTTARIPEEVLGPLFVWSMRFIDDFRADILAADRAWHTPAPPVEPPAYGQVSGLVRAWLDGHLTTGQPLPGWRGKPSLTAIAHVVGCSSISVSRHRRMIDETAALVGIRPQPVSEQPIRGRLDGQPWIEGILADYNEPDSLANLARLLQDACYIVLAFLSGARDSELKHLQRGCLAVERDADGRPYRWKMHSLAFKGESNPAGAPATWSIGEPAARAISVLEQLQPPDSDYLFAPLPHTPGALPDAVNQVLSSGATNARLNRYTAWINDYCQRHERNDCIPAIDQQQWHLTNRQFRRTLAWYIARRPGGVIAGALAFRHHCIQVFEGYAGTSDSGFRAEVESEQALARGEHLIAAIDAHEHTTLTGPAADEAARRLKEFGTRARFHGTVILDEARLRRLMTRHDPAVYPGHYVTCVHDHTKALCEKARNRRSENLPDHGGCKPLACHNVALTNENTAAWQRGINRINHRLASRPPLPPLLQHQLQARHEEITAFLQRNNPIPPESA
jgi:integrase